MPPGPLAGPVTETAGALPPHSAQNASIGGGGRQPEIRETPHLPPLPFLTGFRIRPYSHCYGAPRRSTATATTQPESESEEKLKLVNLQFLEPEDITSPAEDGVR